MANVLKIKRSSVAGKLPLTTDLQLGELAINTTDGRLFTKKNVSATDYIVEFLSTDSAFKTNAVVATTANITLSATQTIDGVMVAVGNRVLVKDQSSAAQNGVYIVAAGAWTRAPDMDTAAKCAGAKVSVNSGTTNGGRCFDTDFKSTDTLGTTSMSWSRALDMGAVGVDVQAYDADLSAIAGLAGTSGFLKKTAANTWSLDTATYLTGNQTITLSGDISGSGATAITTAIGANKVTNAMLAQVATATFKGRTTAATGNVEDLTVTQATAMLNVFSSTLKGLAPASGGGTTNFLRADGTWAAPGITAGVSSFSAGTTGLTPSTATTGAVTLAGTLKVANGGTGATTLTGLVKGNGTSAMTAAVAGTDYVTPAGNVATATNLSTGQSNWSTNGVISAVVGMLGWKNYGNGHVIFDASAGTSPSGGAVNNTNAQVAWTGTYPTLMGWNGSSTYGVRVDSARVADTVLSTYTLLGTINTTSGSSQTLSGLSLSSYRKLYWAYTGLSGSNTGGFFSVNGLQFHVSWGTPATNTVNGYMDVDLSTGLGSYVSRNSIGTQGAANINTGITTASTSITVTYTFTMDGGSIAIYGIK